ncbi:ABC transporter ATP-binding protein [Salipaludibacillus agaradhaerens]|uniref:ABC transporter ATP-binding protein n=1 Tax=Salipaludibacillus agaradhaerens TaxID=76935 RepID=A0A9Q4FYD2_SALAG|nr:ABC transporter ATP-binding protein [Salipaludibacillus agaradhaerens]MCR6095614.1 ABC transporter ATP-binding protein [Salipaludibacillus agaradhaerens]MCR6114826.1 ABC transporter ATP-binding protein [Salipaludibacillus agaradhaerens]
MIEIKNMSKNFGERVIFNNFSCSIKQGEFVVFSGRSGCGKTTLLNIIGGIEKVDNGHVFIDNLDLSNNKDIIKLYREKIGFLFQNFALVENKTVEQNILMIDKRYRTPTTVSSTLEKVGLKGYERNKIYTLSGGEQQRVAIARLFMKKCSIILADEPTGSLDKYNANLIMEHLQELNRSGKTIILVSHDEELKKMGDVIIEL